MTTNATSASERDDKPSIADELDTDILTFLKRHEQKELLRFVAVGSVDDGKSTLIGRMLYDAGMVYEDHLDDATTGTGDEKMIDFARLTDGLRAEREQGITIDVAYRYFTTARRKYIIADTPGHVQYTRNMATGASTADVGVILIDARLGVLTQSRRHAFIASLIRIPKLLVCVNKMDLVDYDQAVFETIRDDFTGFASESDLSFAEVAFVPMSALFGENVVDGSDKMPWYQGPSFLEYLETVEILHRDRDAPFRYPVQTVLRPHLDYRGFAGQVVSGDVSVGEPVLALPSGKTSTVAGIDVYGGELERAHAPQSVSIRLTDEIDTSRGDMLVTPDAPPHVARSFEAMLVWMSEDPLDPAKQYLLKHTSRYVRARVDAVRHRVDLETLEEVPASRLELNDIARVAFTAHRPMVFDAYPDNRATGAFVVVDAISNDTVAAGMIQARTDTPEEATAAGAGPVTAAERKARFGHRGAAVFLEGEGSHALAIAEHIDRQLFALGGLSVVVATSAVEAAHAAKHLVRVGALALIVGRSAVEEAVREALTSDELVVMPPLSGPESGVTPEQAAEDVVSALQATGVLESEA